MCPPPAPPPSHPPGRYTPPHRAPPAGSAPPRLLTCCTAWPDWSTCGGGAGSGEATRGAAAPRIHYGANSTTSSTTSSARSPNPYHSSSSSSSSHRPGRHALRSTSAAASRPPGPLSTYMLVWALRRLALRTPREAALWGPCLAAAAPAALPLLTPRKQVVLLRCMVRACRAAGRQLPPGVADAWLEAFSDGMARARGGTLSYAAAVVAEARLAAPAEWRARWRSAVRR
ncbi:hypothetical protein Agub_g13805, partial [Astrephomene gubernaculifera]